jgi:DNA replication and repair protein RecF
MARIGQRKRDIRCHADAAVEAQAVPLAWIESIRIQNLRCIRAAEAMLGRGLVWIKGSNGAGKTTFLEAIYLLDRGRTFRGRRGGALTTRGEQSTKVSGTVFGAKERSQRIAWDSSGALTRRAGPQFTRFVGATSFSIVEGDPELRRQFFDWSLFHVEHDARQHWERLGRLQRQRNAWLRSGGRGVAVWDDPYATQLEHLWDRRSLFLERVDAAFQQLTEIFLPGGPLQLKWSWTGQGRPLAELLRTQFESDRARGFTFLSPSRGDVAFLRGGAAWMGSRGENKIAGLLLQLSAQEVMVEATGLRPVVLLDDPYAELSRQRVGPLLQAWTRMADQVIVTSLDDVADGDFSETPTMTFHVEQGQLRPS